MSDQYTNEELIAIIDDTTPTIIEGMLIWMDMSEALIEDRAHDESCDGKCSRDVVDEIFDVNKDHLDRVVKSFRTALTDVTAIKDRLTSSDARGTDNG